MSLFDMFKDKATELVQGAKDQLTELTGIELPVDGLVEQAGQAAGTITEAGQNLAGTVGDAVAGAKDKLTGQ